MKVWGLLLVLGVVNAQFVNAQRNDRPELTRILFVFDASGSMFSEWDNEYKIDVAKRILIKLADSLAQEPDIQTALRIYGHQYPASQRNCRDTKLEVPFITSNANDKIRQTLQGIRPKGITPIAYSLERAASDFPRKSPSKNVIILITDGKEECQGDPCAVARALLKRGVSLKPFVIGLNMKEDFSDAFDCMGRYYNVRDPNTFAEILSSVVTQAVSETTVQVSLMDGNGQPKETDVAMTFYDDRSGVDRYNFVHTLNKAGNPDTLTLGISTRYRLVVHTLPKLQKNGILLEAGKHNTIEVPAAQGQLALRAKAREERIQCVVKTAGSRRILNTQQFGTNTKYLEGKYDLEILTLPPIVKKGVSIRAGKTQTIEVPSPADVYLSYTSRVEGSIYLIEPNGSLSWVTRLTGKRAGQRHYLQPGRYKIIYRPQNSNLTADSKTKTIFVSPGSTHSFNLN